MEEEKYVLFLDILGFKDLIENNTMEEVGDIYKHQVIETIGLAIEHGYSKYGIPYSVQSILDGNKLLDTVHDEFNIHIMSDSIIIWTKDNTPTSLIKLCAFTTSFLANTFIYGVPLRGAISKGYVSEMKTQVNASSQSCIVGTGIVNAYQLEGIQKWMGCIVDRECVADLGEEVIKQIHSENITSIVEYEVPIKDEKTSKEYVINWVDTNSKQIIQKEIEKFDENFSRFNKSIDIPSVKIKI